MTNLQIADIHPIHPFPARMAPAIIWEHLPSPDGQYLRILDPMAGSGTTLVSARAKGHQAIGCDTDPLALLIARSWCSDFNSDRLIKRAYLTLEKASTISDNLTPNNAYPLYSDQETRNFLNFWFDDLSRIQLTALAECISAISPSTEKTLLWCAFSRLIITKKLGCSLAMDISHSRPHRKYIEAPILPFDKFLQAVTYIARKAPFCSDFAKGPKVILRNGDARKLTYRNKSIDMIITSPPYLNAIDYIRGHKFSLVWMGYSIRSLKLLRTSNIGSEHTDTVEQSHLLQDTVDRMGNISNLTKRYVGIIQRYVKDMNDVLIECRRVLKREGQAIFVIGDSNINGVYIRNSEGLIHLAQQNGFNLISRTTRQLQENRRYLPPPSAEIEGNSIRDRMREEVILRFN